MTPEEQKFLEEFTALCHKHKMRPFISADMGENYNFFLMPLDASDEDQKWFVDRFGCLYFNNEEELWR